MDDLPLPSAGAFSHDGRQSAAFSTAARSAPSTALLIEYYENVANKDSPSVRVRVSPYVNEGQHSETTALMSPLPTRENTIIDRQRTETEHHTGFEQTADD